MHDQAEHTTKQLIADNRLLVGGLQLYIAIWHLRYDMRHETWLSEKTFGSALMYVHTALYAYIQTITCIVCIWETSAPVRLSAFVSTNITTWLQDGRQEAPRREGESTTRSRFFDARGSAESHTRSWGRNDSSEARIITGGCVISTMTSVCKEETMIYYLVSCLRSHVSSLISLIR